MTSPGTDLAISVTGLVKSYDGSTNAVDGIDLSVPHGEVLAMLGPNGAGKTSTVEILEGYRTRTAGTVSVLGFDPAVGGRAYRERIGIVLQECGIEPNLSVREVLSMRAPLYPSPRPINEVIELVGLTEKAGARVRTLSGGQKRRLDMALCLIGDPELIFLDEPTTGFDPTARRASWEIVRNLCDLGKTVLLTTHYMDEAQALANQVVIINHGRIIASGTPDSIGGRMEGRVMISFDHPASLASLDGLPIPAESTGGRVNIRLGPGEAAGGHDDAVAVMHRLTGWALDHGHDLGAMTMTRPTLEDVYLDLTADHAVGQGTSS